MIAWFIAPYVRRVDTGPMPSRECAMQQFYTQIRADGGDWDCTEVLGNRALVKVRALAATLTTIAGTATFRRIPLAALNDPLSSLTPAQRNAIKNELLDAGYSLAEINEALPDLSVVTLRQVLLFLCRRRLKPRYDVGTDTIVCDGPEQPVLSLDEVDGAIV